VLGITYCSVTPRASQNAPGDRISKRGNQILYGTVQDGVRLTECSKDYTGECVANDKFKNTANYLKKAAIKVPNSAFINQLMILG